jgi:hypothetical protein
VLLILSSINNIKWNLLQVQIFSPKVLLTSGIICFIVSIVWEILYQTKQTAQFNKNMCLTFGNMEISFKIDDIQSITDSSHTSAFVLPITTDLSEDCITSQNCAAGAFIIKHHSQRLERLKKILTEKANSKENNYCDIESVIVLPDDFNIPGKVFLVATSEHDKRRMTNPTIIFSSMKNVFHEATNYEIKHLYLPVIGSGHGGMNLTEALNLLIICFAFLSKEYPERRKITICIREEDKKDIKPAFLHSFY